MKYPWFSQRDQRWLIFSLVYMKVQFKPKIYRRYIDDTFLVFSVQQVENFKQYLNLNTMLISNSFLRLK